VRFQENKQRTSWGTWRDLIGGWSGFEGGQSRRDRIMGSCALSRACRIKAFCRAFDASGHLPSNPTMGSSIAVAEDVCRSSLVEAAQLRSEVYWQISPQPAVQVLARHHLLRRGRRKLYIFH